MIRFACHCGHRFELPESEAGLTIQCTACGRLNDVPNLGDLAALDPDGTFHVDVQRPVDNPYRIQELALIYSQGTRDADGDEIDMRVTAGDVGPPLSGEAADAEDDYGEIPFKDDVSPERAKPRYDPETGELIRPLDIKVPTFAADPENIPMAKAALGYASGGYDPRVSPRGILLALFQPANIGVLAIVTISQFIWRVLMIIPASILAFWGVPLWVFSIPLAVIVLGHYGNAIEDAGPAELDELGRPLRDFGLYDDLIRPFCLMTVGLALCYAPAVFVGNRALDMGGTVNGLAVAGAAFALAVGGTVLGPSVLLTLMTSGELSNLAPHRVLAVVRIAGLSYWVSVLGLAVSLPLLVLSLFGLGILPEPIRPDSRWVNLFDHPLTWIPLLAVSGYAMHAFCWHLGKIYRAHHQEFPWAWQRFVPDPNKRRAVGALPNDPTSTAAAAAASGSRRDTRAKLRALREAERRSRQRAGAGQPPPPMAQRVS